MLIISQDLPPIGTNVIALIIVRATSVLLLMLRKKHNWAKTALDHDCEIVALILTHGQCDHIIDAHKFSTAEFKYSAKRRSSNVCDPAIMSNYVLPS